MSGTWLGSRKLSCKLWSCPRVILNSTTRCACGATGCAVNNGTGPSCDTPTSAEHGFGITKLGALPRWHCTCTESPPAASFEEQLGSCYVGLIHFDASLWAAPGCSQVPGLESSSQKTETALHCRTALASSILRLLDELARLERAGQHWTSNWGC